MANETITKKTLSAALKTFANLTLWSSDSQSCHFKCFNNLTSRVSPPRNEVGVLKAMHFLSRLRNLERVLPLEVKVKGRLLLSHPSSMKFVSKSSH